MSIKINKEALEKITLKNKQLEIKRQLKVEEDKKREALANQVKLPKMIDFNIWYTSRKALIPRHHYKEVLRADFTSRGLKEQELDTTYDTALVSYGVKLPK